MSTLYRGIILFGSRDEDSNDTSFIWGRVITQSPKDEQGKPVQNPGSVMVYGAKGIGTGDCEEVLLMSRGIGGLYDLVPAAQQEKILNALGTTLDKIPEVPLAESSSTGRGISRDEARERARANRQARRNSRAVSPAVAVEQPE